MEMLAAASAPSLVSSAETGESSSINTPAQACSSRSEDSDEIEGILESAPATRIKRKLSQAIIDYQETDSESSEEEEEVLPAKKVRRLKESEGLNEMFQDLSKRPFSSRASMGGLAACSSGSTSSVARNTPPIPRKGRQSLPAFSSIPAASYSKSTDSKIKLKRTTSRKNAIRSISSGALAIRSQPAESPKYAPIRRRFNKESDLIANPPSSKRPRASLAGPSATAVTKTKSRSASKPSLKAAIVSGTSHSISFRRKVQARSEEEQLESEVSEDSESEECEGARRTSKRVVKRPERLVEKGSAPFDLERALRSEFGRLSGSLGRLGGNLRGGTVVNDRRTVRGSRRIKALVKAQAQLAKRSSGGALKRTTGHSVLVKNRIVSGTVAKRTGHGVSAGPRAAKKTDKLTLGKQIGRRKRAQVEDANDDSDSDDDWDDDDYEEERGKRNVEKAPHLLAKKWLTKGLYAPDELSVAVPTAGTRSEKAKVMKGVTILNPALPLPVHYGAHFLEEERDFQLDYNLMYKWSQGALGQKRKPDKFVSLRSIAYPDRPKDGCDPEICQCELPSQRELDAGVEACGENCMNRLMQYVCHPKTCPCGELCSNGPLHKRQQALTQVFWAGARGHGLRAAEPIEADQFVLDYRGEVVTIEEYYTRVETIYKGRKHFYALDYGSGEVIDAGQKGNVARFINHSCEPNLEVRRVTTLGAGLEEYEIGFFALRPIQRGEELSYNYKFHNFSVTARSEAAERAAKRLLLASGEAAPALMEYEEARPCLCGAPTCRRWLGKALDEPEPSARSKMKAKIGSTKAKVVGKVGRPKNSATSSSLRRNASSTFMKPKAKVGRPRKREKSETPEPVKSKTANSSRKSAVLSSPRPTNNTASKKPKKPTAKATRSDLKVQSKQNKLKLTPKRFTSSTGTRSSSIISGLKRMQKAEPIGHSVPSPRDQRRLKREREREEAEKKSEMDVDEEEDRDEDTADGLPNVVLNVQGNRRGLHMRERRKSGLESAPANMNSSAPPSTEISPPSKPKQKQIPASKSTPAPAIPVRSSLTKLSTAISFSNSLSIKSEQRSQPLSIFGVRIVPLVDNPRYDASGPNKPGWNGYYRRYFTLTGPWTPTRSNTGTGSIPIIRKPALDLEGNMVLYTFPIFDLSTTDRRTFSRPQRRRMSELKRKLVLHRIKYHTRRAMKIKALKVRSERIARLRHAKKRNRETPTVTSALDRSLFVGFLGRSVEKPRSRILDLLTSVGI